MTLIATLDMAFPERLAAIRKEKNLTQRALAKRVGLSVLQINRYEAGTSQPTLEVIRKLALTLGVTSDMLLFEKSERGPDDDLRLQFERIAQFDPEDKRVIKAVLDGLILRHEAKRLSSSGA